MNIFDKVIRTGVLLTCIFIVFYLKRIYDQLASVPRYSDLRNPSAAVRQGARLSLPVVYLDGGSVDISDLPEVTLSDKSMPMEVTLVESRAVLKVTPDDAKGAKPFPITAEEALQVKPDTSITAEPFPVTAPQPLEVKPELLEGEPFPVRVVR